MTIDRRSLLAASLAALPARSALAATTLDRETIPLWPGDAPGLTNAALSEVVTNASKVPSQPNRSITGVRRPRLELFRPTVRTNGSALLVIPGGGYGRVVIDNEGYAVAAGLAARGFTAFVLTYRLPADGWRDSANTPLADAQRAMRLIRARAASYGIDPGRVGAMGFSAGGHLCADLATRFGRVAYGPVDTADRLDARPAIAAPIYPVVSMEPDLAHAGSRTKLIGEHPTEATMIEHAPDRQVTTATPPMFLVHAADDGVVNVANTIALHAAARAVGVPVEMHLFERGGHGFGWATRAAPLPVHLWPELFVAWARSQRFID